MRCVLADQSLSIYGGASVALAQITPTPVAHPAPEFDWAVAGSALPAAQDSDHTNQENQRSG